MHACAAHKNHSIFIVKHVIVIGVASVLATTVSKKLCVVLQVLKFDSSTTGDGW